MIKLLIRLENIYNNILKTKKIEDSILDLNINLKDKWEASSINANLHQFELGNNSFHGIFSKTPDQLSYKIKIDYFFSKASIKEPLV